MVILGRLAKMESLFFDLLLIILFELGEVFCDFAILRDQILVSLVSYNRGWSLNHGHLIEKFFLINLIVFVNTILSIMVNIFHDIHLR